MPQLACAYKGASVTAELGIEAANALDAQLLKHADLILYDP